MNPPLKPFVKWAGGKGQLLSSLRSAYPEGIGTSIPKYAEPFVGAGAVLFDLLSTHTFEEAYISDVNAELINAYQIIRNDVSGLIEALASLQAAYLALVADGRKQFYYEKRDRFNALKTAESGACPVEKAALFIFLNKTCFNGLYRVNRSGLFNVPAGAYQNPRICDAENLQNLSAALQPVTIACGGYQQSASIIDSDTFVYFDPPYRPLTQTANFTSYAKGSFGDPEQAELAAFAAQMSERGARVLLSNSDPRNADPNDDFFDRIYSGFFIRRVKAARFINSNASARGKINELLISSYPTKENRHPL